MATKQALDWRQVHQNSTIVDLHAHPSLKVSLFKRALTTRLRASRAFDPFSVRTDFSRLTEGQVDVLLSTVYAPEKDILDECAILRLLRWLMPRAYHRAFGRPYFEITMEMLNTMEQAVAKSKQVQMAHSLSELDAILNQPNGRPVAVVHNVEGGHSLDHNLENLQKLFDRGVAYLTLAHFYPNPAVHPIFPYPESVQKFSCFRGDRDLTLGLTEFGEQVVEKMVELGMILDISHCTPPARERIYQIVGTRAPLIASHVGAYEINPSPYNLKDEEIKQIAATGGVVAVIFMNYWLMPHETKRGLNFVARTIDHFVQVGGEDFVAIGSDYDGFTDPPDDLKDASELGNLTQRLLAEGYTPERINKIWGQNALRVLHDGWGKK